MSQSNFEKTIGTTNSRICFLIASLLLVGIITPVAASDIIVPLSPQDISLEGFNYGYDVAYGNTEGYLVVGGGSGGNIYAQFIDSTGALSGPKFIAAAPTLTYNGPSDPSVAYNGEKFLVVYIEDNHIKGVFIENGIPGSIFNIAPYGNHPDVASDGKDFLVCWGGYSTSSGITLGHIYAASVSSSGSVGSQFLVGNQAKSQGHSSITFGGGAYFITWEEGVGLNDPNLDIYGARVTSSGTVLDPEGIAICTAPGSQFHSWAKGGVASSGSQYFVAWDDYRDGGCGKIYGARISSETGVLIDGPAETGTKLICAKPGCCAPRSIQVGFDGTTWLVVWADVRVKGIRVSQTFDVLDSTPMILTRYTSQGSEWYSALTRGNDQYFVVWSTRINSEPTYVASCQPLGITDVPVANAGADVMTPLSGVVMLDGSGSYDPDSTLPLQYQWMVLSAPSYCWPTLTNPTSSTPSFTPVCLGNYEFQLIVNDGYGVASVPDTVMVKVEPANTPPTATPDSYSTDEDTSLTIPSSGVLANDIDPDGQTLTAVIKSEPSNGVLSFASNGGFTYNPNPNFYGTDTFTYQANDGRIDSNLATVTITVSPVNDVPVGFGQTITIDEDVSKSITLTGSDIDEDTLMYTIVTSPSHGTLTGIAPVLSYTPYDNYNGPDSFTFTVTDGHVSSAPAMVAISVIPVNDAPFADAGEDQLLSLIGTTVTLDGHQSYDEEGDPLSYQWAFVSKPIGSSAMLNDGTTATPAFIADRNGEYTIQLVVSDGFSWSSPDEVVCSFQNVRPVANAGSSQSIALGEQVNLDGSQSFDLNSDPIIYRWSLVEVPSGSTSQIADPLRIKTTFVPDRIGTYVIQLVVNDGIVDSDPSTIQIEVIIKETQVIIDIQNLETYVSTVPVDTLKNSNMQNSLNNKLNVIIADVSDGNYNGAIDKLQNDILAKTDGCAISGSPDKNDWITDCGVQTIIYPQLLSIINKIETL